jgi:site-specific DNA recombinase
MNYNQIQDDSPKKFFIYCRKSTDAEDRQLLSIDAQLSELFEIATKQNLHIVKTFTECRSAKEVGRPVFEEMLAEIKSGKATAILAWKLDRLARNFDDGGKIIGLLQRGVIQEIKTFDRSYFPSDNVLLIAVELGMANQYVRDLSVNIRRGIREKIRRGMYCGSPPLGYFTEPKLRTVEPHPQLHPKLKDLFEEFAEGRDTLTTFRDKLTAAGFRGKLSGNPKTVSSVTMLLRNPFYYGAFLHKGELHEGTHVPLVSKQTFDKIQSILTANGRPRKTTSKGFHFLNLLRCDSCGFAITAEQHMKKSGRRYTYYRCTQKSRSVLCTQRVYVTEQALRAEIKRVCQLISLPDLWKDRFLEQLNTFKREHRSGQLPGLRTLEEELAEVENRIKRVNEAFLEGSIEATDLATLKNPLVERRINIQQSILKCRRDGEYRLEPLKAWILAANQVFQWVKDEDWDRLKTVLQNVGSNRRLRGQELVVVFKPLWNYLAETSLAIQKTDDPARQNLLMWTLLTSSRTQGQKSSTGTTTAGLGFEPAVTYERPGRAVLSLGIELA